MKLENSIAVVTGGASGLGLGTVMNFVEGGAKVVVWDLNEQLGEEVRRKLNVAFFKVDVRDVSSVEQALHATLQLHGHVDILVNCAGIYDFGPVLSRSYNSFAKAWDRVFGVNVIGSFNCIRLVAQHMAYKATEGPRGVIITTASIAGHYAPRGLSIYGASKGAILGMNLALARDLGAHGVRVNSISPGVFDTPMGSQVTQVSKDKIAKTTLVGRLGKAEDYGHLARTIVENDYLTGNDILLDGGIRL